MAKALHVSRSHFGRIAVLEMSSSLTTHSHPDLHLICKLGGEDGRFEVGGESIALTDGQAVVVNCWEPHAYQHSARDRTTLVLVCNLDPLWLTTVLGFQGFGCAWRKRSFAVTPQLREQVRHLAFHVLLNGEDTAGSHAASLAALLKEIRNAFRTSHQQEGAGVEQLEKLADDRRIAAVLRHMREHMDERIDIDAMASRFGLSRQHLYHLFQQRLGLPPHVCWNSMRMEYALQQLAKPRRSGIKQVAFDLGFNSQSNFTRFFQSIQGVSPREYQAAASRRKS